MQLQQPVPAGNMPAPHNDMPMHGMQPPMPAYNHYQHQPVPMQRPARRLRVNFRKLAVVVFMLATLGLLGANLYFTINPPYMQTLQLRQQILDEVSRIAVVNVFEDVQMSRIKDADALRKQSGVNALVYKDAKSGDYVVAFSDKLIIYRREEKKVIYDGDTPVAIAQKQRQEALDMILKKARADKIITATDSELGTPSIEDVGDIAARKKNDPAFFENAKEGDIVASFGTLRLVILYRASTDQIINYGVVSLADNK